MTGEEDIIQEKTEPMHELSNGPDSIKKQKENKALACETGGGVF